MVKYLVCVLILLFVSACAMTHVSDCEQNPTGIDCMDSIYVHGPDAPDAPEAPAPAPDPVPDPESSDSDEGEGDEPTCYK